MNNQSHDRQEAEHLGRSQNLRFLTVAALIIQCSFNSYALLSVLQSIHRIQHHEESHLQ